MSTDHAHQDPPTVEAPAEQGEVAGASGSDTPSRVDDHWLVRDPVRTGFLLIIVVSLVVRLNVLRDSYFITDDFMLMSRAVESPFGWDYLGRVHTGHFEPVGFAVMWALAHFAPWNWGAAVSVIMIGLLIVFVLVWRLLVELFGRRGLTLVPFALFCFSPLTLPATTWLSAAIIWIPLMASVAGMTRQHVKFVRTGHTKHAVWAVAWLAFGFMSFEKILVALPYILVLTFALQPDIRCAWSPLWRLFVRTRAVWFGYAALTTAYLVLYVGSLQRDEGRSTLYVPSVSQLWDFTYLSVFRTLIPASFGGPWRWQPVGYGGALVDSPRFFDWIAFCVACALIVLSLASRRAMARHWAALLVYLAGSLGVLAAGRVALGGPILALETRYLADAAVPLAITIGAAIMPLVGERDPWRPFAERMRAQVTPRRHWIGVLSVGTLIALSLHAMNSYVAVSSANPYRAFVDNVRESLAELPDDAEIWDTALPVDIVGPIFEEYNLVSRFVAPMLTPAERSEIAARSKFTRPYYLDRTGLFQPMWVEGFSSPPPIEGLCGWTAENGRVAVPLADAAFEWDWVVRVGYLTDGETEATVRLGDDSQDVQLSSGLGEVFVPLLGGGREVVIDGLDPGVDVCVGDVQVGTPKTR